MRKENTWRLRHPSATVVAVVLKLTTAEREASSVTLTLRQASALLTHLRSALKAALAAADTPIGRCAICTAEQSADRALLAEAEKALRHVEGCGACGEDSWASCASGGQHAARTLAELAAALARAEQPEEQP